MSKRNNKPIWLVLALASLGILTSFLAHMIVVDTQIDERSRVDTNFAKQEKELRF